MVSPEGECQLIIPDGTVHYSAFQIYELHRHNQNLAGTLHETSLLWSTDMKNAVLSTGKPPPNYDLQLI
ncbi:MAG: hypothetical protein MGU50_22200 [Trichodesmium sp. MAG_R02]|nr:hypothetical protein [Trichodesmium sp. MAG_R02]